MIDSCTRSPDGKTFTLSINGEQHTYPNDKAGKRQAILDGLNAIPTMTAGGDTYLPGDDALQVVAAVMYPGGIQTEKAYDLVQRTAAKACTHLGYGEEIQLGPPLVSFSERGSYRKRYPAVASQWVLAELEAASISGDKPQKEMMAQTVWNQAAWEVYGQSWRDLPQPQQDSLKQQVEAIAQEANWRQKMLGSTLYYTQPLTPDMEKARQEITAVLTEAEGAPIYRFQVVVRTQTAAYGRKFYEPDLPPELEETLRQLLDEFGYDTQPKDGEYRPRPFKLPDTAAEQFRERLPAIPQHQTRSGTALLFRDVRQMMRDIPGLPALSDWQANQLVTSGALGTALRQSGYKAVLQWLQPYQFVPALDSMDAHLVILKELRVRHDPDKTVSLAKGFRVYTPAVVLDSDNDNIVYLEMVGHKQAVRANWAALVGKKVNWIGGQRIYLEGMKAHVMVRSSLPCGWADHILIHKQASIREMNPEEAFFLLDDGRQPIPPLFYPMLNKCLAVPVLEEWAGYLWENGRERRLITLLNDGEGQGYAAWRVLPAADEWQSIIQAGLQEKTIDF